MPGDYAVLAPIYDEIGLADFAQKMTPSLINFAQRNDWMGRRIMDLGCGTGVSAKWLCEKGFVVTGVDQKTEMLEVARANLSDVARSLFTPIQQDVRALDSIAPVDMVLALNLMNEMESLRDLEAVFKVVQKPLASGKLFLFDMHTIEGLTRRGQRPDDLLHDGDLTVFTRNQYDYDRQMHTQRFIIFRREGDRWQRHEANVVLRAYPVQAIASLLMRSGFSIMRVLNADMETFDPATSSGPRVIFVAQRQ